jgi:Protein of unknown function (DUF3866)
VPSFRELEVVAILEQRDDLVRVRACGGGQEVVATGYPYMLGEIRTGDRIVVNMTGVDLGLGTGGEGFILWNLAGRGPGRGPEGHIMKLRYTPWQMNVMSVESPESPHHDALVTLTSIAGMPVVVCGLHSQIAGVAAGVKAAVPGAEVGYLMTDGGALPLAWSRLVRDLKTARLLDVTCTTGHAFGGDLESVNVFSGLTALHTVGRADVAIVAMGPGGVGTSSALGFSGMEVGGYLDAAAALEGNPVACLRVSFHDERSRHQAVSHHSLTALALAASRRCTVAVPLLPENRAKAVEGRLQAAGIADKHELVHADGAPGVELLREKEVSASSMGVPLEDTPEPWLAAAAAGRVAAGLL